MFFGGILLQVFLSFVMKLYLVWTFDLSKVQALVDDHQHGPPCDFDLDLYRVMMFQNYSCLTRMLNSCDVFDIHILVVVLIQTHSQQAYQ